MCKLSIKLKLCTCDAAEASELQHYWVLHRFNAGKKNFVIGRTRIPDTLDMQAEAYNRSLLLERLHEDDTFDIDLKLQNGDRLQLTFRCSEPDVFGQKTAKTITYGYTWTDGRWAEEPFSSLSWQWHHDEETFGRLCPALEGGHDRG